MMNDRDRDARRTKIVRRWAAYRISRAQKEIWARRKKARGVIDEESGLDEDGEVRYDEVAELPDVLLD